MGNKQVGWPWAGPGSGAELDSSSVPVPAAPHTAGCAMATLRQHSHRDGCTPYCGSCWHTLGSSSWQENPNSLLPSALVPFPAAWHSLEATWNSGAASVLTLCHSEHPAVGTVRALMQHSLVSGDLWQTAEQEGAGRDYFVFSPQLYQAP